MAEENKIVFQESKAMKTKMKKLEEAISKACSKLLELHIKVVVALE